jgi:hypothetical protein
MDWPRHFLDSPPDVSGPKDAPTAFLGAGGCLHYRGVPAFLRADVLRAIRAGGRPVGPPVCVRELQILAPLGAC